MRIKTPGFFIAGLLSAIAIAGANDRQPTGALFQQSWSGGAQSADRVQDIFKKRLAPYLRGIRDFRVEMEPFSSEQIQKGKFKKVRVRITGGEAGDFRHQNFGLPFVAAEATVTDLVVDPEKFSNGELEAWSAGVIQVNAFELREADINAALAKAEGEWRLWRVTLHPGVIRLQRIGKIKGTVEVKLRIAPDPKRPASENIWLDIESGSVARLSFSSKLLQWLIRDHNPLIDLKGLQATVRLGNLELSRGRIILGSRGQRK
ncbi:LmeA family phospholipid-binding protein [candidate division FCPU426 bacterium]|nr:LmeA family phospholipid-binding protein [candidate division FCPU426 bacterium]